MRHASATRLVLLAVGALLVGSTSSAQDLALPPESEAGFRRLIEMAQTGRLGEDVTNANVGVSKGEARIELVRPGRPIAVLLLTPKRSRHSISRYFDVAAGDGATARDVARVARALDEAFGADPFELRGLEGSPGDTPPPPLGAAWDSDSWRGILRVLEWRMMALVSLEYTVGVIAFVALGMLASLVVLWTSIPPRPGAR